MPLLLLAAFVTLPLIELYVLIAVGREIGALSTVGLCLLTAAAGAVLIRAQGLATLTSVQRGLQAGEVPAIELLEGAVLLLCGALLLTPGLVTDAIGFLCLIPPLRRAAIVGALGSRIRPLGPGGPGGPGDPGGPRVIEGEYRREDDPDAGSRPGGRPPTP